MENSYRLTHWVRHSFLVETIAALSDEILSSLLGPLSVAGCCAGRDETSKDAVDTVNETTVVAGVDLLPSVAALTKVNLPADARFDDEDLNPSWLGQTRQLRHRPLFWNRPPDRPGSATEAWPDLSMREGDWKLLLMEDGSGAQLYNLAKDPGETHNLAKSEPKLVQRLSQELLEWRKALPIQSPPR